MQKIRWLVNVGLAAEQGKHLQNFQIFPLCRTPTPSSLLSGCESFCHLLRKQKQSNGILRDPATASVPVRGSNQFPGSPGFEESLSSFPRNMSKCKATNWSDSPVKEKEVQSSKCLREGNLFEAQPFWAETCSCARQSQEASKCEPCSPSSTGVLHFLEVLYSVIRIPTISSTAYRSKTHRPRSSSLPSGCIIVRHAFFSSNWSFLP